MDAPQRHDPLRGLLLIGAGVLCFVLGAAWHGCTPAAQAGVYGNRIDKHGARVRWMTVVQPDQGVDFEVPNQGTVSVFLVGEELFIHAEGDQDAGRSVVVRGVVVNQLRVGFEK
jgi:hypothetical protein